MSSLYKNRAVNKRKTFFLMSIFLTIVLGTAWFFSNALNSPIIFYIAVIISIFVNIKAYWFSHKTIIKLTKAKEIDRKNYFDYWNLVENLCIRIGCPMPKLYIIEDTSPNAFATGRNQKNGAIVVTRGLLEMMNKNELEGVLAHELAHIQNRDTLLMTSVVVLFGMIAIMSDLTIRSQMFSGDNRDSGKIGILIFAVYLITSIVLKLIQMVISREREYLADSSAAIYTRYPEGLASALSKIRDASIPLKNASSSTAHLFISDPFAINKQKKESITSKFLQLFDTHPPIEKRIQALQKH